MRLKSLTRGVSGAEPPRVMTPDERRSKALRRFAMSITLATVLGHTVLGFEQAYLTPVVGVLTGVLMEAGLEAMDAWATGRTPKFVGIPKGAVIDFFLPSYIGGLAVAMLLYGNANLMPTVLAVMIGVSSKYVLRVKMTGAKTKHFMNPSNFGIAAVLVLFPWVGIAPPYQFTEWVSGWVDALVPAVVLILGTMINGKLTGKLPLIAGWVGGFILQAAIRGTLTDVSFISAVLPITGVAFVLYTNYMITDPGTSPFKARNQVAFGLATAAVYGLLVQFHVVFGLFFALTIVCAGRGAGLALMRWSVPAPLVSPKPVLAEKA